MLFTYIFQLNTPFKMITKLPLINIAVFLSNLLESPAGNTHQSIPLTKSDKKHITIHWYKLHTRHADQNQYKDNYWSYHDLSFLSNQNSQ